MPAAWTRPWLASWSAAPDPQGHQAKATGGSSRDSGVASSGSAGSQPATTRVGRGGAMGRTAISSVPEPARPVATAGAVTAGTGALAGLASPPAGRKPSPAPVSPLSGKATNRSPTGASATRSLPGRSGAMLVANTGAAGSPGPNSSSTPKPSARASASATRS